MASRVWKDEEVTSLRAMTVEGLSPARIAFLLKRRETTVLREMMRLSLRKTHHDRAVEERERALDLITKLPLPEVKARTGLSYIHLCRLIEAQEKR